MELKRWREESGLTQAALGQELELSQSQVSRYEENPDQIPYGLLKKWMARLGVDPGREPLVTEQPSAPIDAGAPWVPLRAALDRVEAACESFPAEAQGDWLTGLSTVEEVREEASKLRRKPNLMLAGRSDSGKSKLANSFLGRHLLPTRYGPMTRLVTHVRHLEDRPEWMGDDLVAVVGEAQSLEALGDAELRERVLKKRGGLELLQSLATYAVGAVADADPSESVHLFSDAPVLRAANIVDLPGSRGAKGHADVDAKRAQEAVSAADVLVYASPVMGFIDGLDLEFLSHWIRALPATELDDEAFAPLSHLLIVATHASHHLSFGELRDQVLAGGRDRLWQHLGETAIKERSELIGRAIDRADFDGRFFAFWAERPEIRDPLHRAVADCLGNLLPNARRQRAARTLGSQRHLVKERLEAELRSLAEAAADLEKALAAHQAVLVSEKLAAPLRRRRRRALEEAFDRTATEVIAELERSWTKRTSSAEIEKLIKARYAGQKAKELARQSAASAVLELVRNDVFRATARATRRLPEELARFLAQYDEVTSQPEVSLELSAMDLPTDETGIFAGLVSADIGAMAGLSGGLTVTLAGLAWSIFGSSWQSRLAKKIAEKLAVAQILEQFASGIAQHWHSRRARFEAEAASLEVNRHERLRLHGQLLDQAQQDKRILEVRREALSTQLGFFNALPVPPAA